MSVNMKNIPSLNRAGLIHSCLFSFDGLMMWRWDWNPQTTFCECRANEPPEPPRWSRSVDQQLASNFKARLLSSSLVRRAQLDFFCSPTANPICCSGFWHPADEVKHSKLKKTGFEPMPSRIRIRVWCDPGSNPNTDRCFKGKLVECEKIMQLLGLH